LIAGPIVHHAEMMPQFKAGARVSADHLARGITWFGIGLFKKTVIADSLSVYGSPVFKAVASGGEPTFFEAWGGALAYTGQIYFDFSGYSDMAIGLALLFGIRLPYNFSSPYKAQNMIEFWRTWHMTLSRFLRDYLYFPLGGNRKGTGQRYLNLFITMVLGGIWHGAGWSFLVWGTLHGAYLVVNHGWRNLCRRWGWGAPGFFARGAYRALTFLAVVVGWVFFRTADLPTAGRMFKGMIGQHGWVLNDNLEPLFGFMKSWGVQFGATGSFNDDGIIPIVIALLLAFYAPNSQAMMDGTAKRLRWKMNFRWTLAVAALLLLGFMQLGTVSEFLYFQF
jgi:alginate O-acetyltransferase complex protein AlgI